MDKYLKFSWVIDRLLGGCAKPCHEEHLEFLYNQGIRALVRLEKGGFKREEVINFGIEDFPEFIPDFKAPSQNQIDKIINFIKSHLSNGKPVAVSCGAGKGRTGTILTCYLINEGYSFEDAESFIRKKGRTPYEVPAQKEAIEKYARRQISS
jgi:atypical dual specificity phosphatase